MAFNSLQFLIFFPTVLLLYYLTAPRHRWIVLLAASYYFYMSWRPIYGLLLFGTSVLTYGAGVLIDRAPDQRTRKGILVGCILSLVGILFVYKYFNFFNDTARALFAVLRLDYSVSPLDLILPLGISFHTFQLTGYVVDLYQRKIPAERDFGRFCLFASFWPQLIAGPIERAKNLIPELRKHVSFDYDNVTSGLRLMAWGFFKKVVVADHLAQFVNAAYQHPDRHDGISLMAGTIYFAFQVYCDFSGYTDIAIGAARTMGIKLMDNFRQPYFSTSISEFWKRWHISLSTWLTDYVYTPLTQSKKIRLKWYPKFLLSLFLTFLVSGLWHGAAWTFVAWGALHGTYLICSMLTQNVRKRFVQVSGLARVPVFHTVLKVLMTFSLVCISYIFFRAESLRDGVYILTHLFAWSAPAGHMGVIEHVLHKVQITEDSASYLIAMFGIAVVIAVDAFARYGKPGQGWAVWPAWGRWPAYCGLVAGTILLGAFYGNARSFIYFQF
jgi:alginate O-acetyltransferase complex protein AlgI